MPDTDRDYHISRARDELDLAYKSEKAEAIASHMRLSALHMERATSNTPAEDPDRPSEGKE